MCHLPPAYRMSASRQPFSSRMRTFGSENVFRSVPWRTRWRPSPKRCRARRSSTPRTAWFPGSKHSGCPRTARSFGCDLHQTLVFPMDQVARVEQDEAATLPGVGGHEVKRLAVGIAQDHGITDESVAPWWRRQWAGGRSQRRQNESPPARWRSKAGCPPCRRRLSFPRSRRPDKLSAASSRAGVESAAPAGWTVPIHISTRATQKARVRSMVGIGKLGDGHWMSER